MSLLIQYLIKLTISLSVVWLFYQFVLRRLTFYNSNRWYLLGYTFLSFFIPFINISSLLETKSNALIQFVPSIHQYTIELEEASQCPVPLWSTQYDKWDFIGFGIITIAGLLFIRFVVSFFSFLKLKRQSKLISNEGGNIYQVDKDIIPFSFGNSVFINSNLHSENELEEIIKHEFVHVRQKHTIDIIWAELLCIINWYNPFAWLLKSSIRQNLEFIADNKVIQNGINKKEYQYLLLKVIGNKQFSIATQFNFSSLKKRIAMMNKLKSAKVHMLKFLFLLPLAAILLLAFRSKLKDSNSIVENNKSKTETKKMVSEMSAATDANPGFAEGVSSNTRIDTLPQKTNSKGYIIDIIDKKGSCTVVVKNKNNKEVKRLLLTDWNAKKDHYTNLYGEIPSVADTVESEDVVEVPADIKEVIAVGKPITLKDFVVAPDIKEVTVGKPITTSDFAVKPDLKDVVVVGKPAKVSTTVYSNVVADVNTVADAKGVIAPSVTISDELEGQLDIALIIDKKTKPEELESFINKCKEKGYDLSFSNKNYKDGLLTELAGTIKYKGSSSSFSFTDFEKLTIAVYRDGDDVFFRTYTGKKRTRS